VTQKIDLSQHGFSDIQTAGHATHSLLRHLERLGIAVMPAAEPLEFVQQTAPEPAHVTASTGESSAAVPSGTDRPRMQNAAAQDSIRAASNPPPPARQSQPGAGSPALRSALPPRDLPERNRFAAASKIETDATDYSLPVLDEAQRQAALRDAAEEVSRCRRCAELVISRRRTVYGEGNLQPRICFFGEAPGADEDRTGRPFVGKAGQLLTKMIEACTFQREDCYILNTIKCRPPGNRNPSLQEVENCRGYFQHQLDVLQPQYVVCLGLVAARALLATTLPVGRLRGVFHRYRSSKVIVTYHPAYLLRNPEAKRAAWDDLQLMLRDMGIDPKAGRS
jgi:DNA polymerase